MFSKIAWMILSIIFITTAFGQTPLTSQQEPTKEYTLEEKNKLKQALELAKHFVQRWHETLDLAALIDELFVVDESIHRKVAEDGLGIFIDDWNEGIDLGFHQFAVSILDGTRARKAAVAWLNIVFITSELKLYYSEQEVNEIALKLESVDKSSKAVYEWFQKYKPLHSVPSQNISDVEKDQARRIFDRFTQSLELVVSSYRTKLSRDVFETAKYKANLKQEYGHIDEKIVGADDPIYEEMGLQKGAKVYQVKRGIFRLVITEEQKRFRVLSIRDC